MKKLLIILSIIILFIIAFNYKSIHALITDNILVKETTAAKKGSFLKKNKENDLNNPDIKNETIEVGNFKLTLSGCNLYYEGLGKSGVLKLSFPEPCMFSKNKKGEIRVVYTAGKTKTLLVGSYKEIEPFEYKGKIKKQYDTYARAIVISDTEIRLSREIARGSLGPPKLGDEEDEKLFQILAADTVPITELEVKNE